ncbi:MAG: SGNH/GDSL hydrolase family protein [Clostridia bacterium]|nr:SGNH/GDSL hydrolase family protein [Clostridia bacterium]
MEKRPLSLEEIDPNFKLVTEIGEADAVFYDVMDEPFEKYGFYNCSREEGYKRLPDEIAQNVNAGVAELYRHTAGGRVRFSTDSRYIAIRVQMPKIHHHPHMPLSGGAGFDLYVDDPTTGDSRYCKAKFFPQVGAKDGFVGKITFPTRKMRHFTLYFPNYNEVDAVYLGLQKDASLGGGVKYRNDAPVVFYGSSITQGGCASRPGNAYVNVVGRRLGLDILNLGFSGSGRGEDVIVDYMAKLPMSAFICDYDHNAPNAEHLKKTHLKLYRRIRAAHPDIPFVIMSKPDFNFSLSKPCENSLRRDVIYETYRQAILEGDENVYFVDGESLFCGKYEDMCTVDGTHPNDLGMALMADAVEATLRRILLCNYI